MMPQARRSGPLAAAAFGGFLLPGHCPPASPPPAEVQGNADFVLAGVHPAAAEQPTETGRVLATLAAWEGRIYAGYGDISANTGPIAIMPYDPESGAFVHEALGDTEAVYLYRPVGGQLYAPAIDPRSRADFSVGKPWRDERPVDAYHVFDVASLTGADLWLVGSRELDAVAWRRPHGDAAWEESLRVPPVSDKGDEFARFYFAGVLGGRLYVQSRNSRSGPRPASRVFDGDEWRDGPDLLPEREDFGWHPVTFAGRLVYQSRHPVAGPSRLLAFDGTRVEPILAAPIYDFSVDGERLFVLFADGGVVWTSDLSSWTPVATAPAGSRSLGTLAGWLYLGTKDATLFRSRRPLY